MHADRRQGPVGLVKGHAAEAQGVVDADFGLLEGGPIGALEGEGGAELLGPTGRIPFDPELVHGHRDLAVAAAVEQVQFPAGG